MSRTKRYSTTTQKEELNNETSQLVYTWGRRMKQYAKQRGKHIPDGSRRTGASKMAKLIAKNANRSAKKSLRQQAKRQIIISIQDNNP